MLQYNHVKVIIKLLEIVTVVSGDKYDLQHGFNMAFTQFFNENIYLLCTKLVCST